jgi:lipopolysaccharide export system permease protein
MIKILDRYIAKSFLVGYAIAFCVLIGLRIVIELFVNLDEFAEGLSSHGTWAVVAHILTFYGYRTTIYFRDIAGVITVVAAAFSLGKMVRSNELAAMIASGVSAKRIVGPILVLALFFAGLSIADQELLIPALSDKLVQNEDEWEGAESFSVWFLSDGNRSLICSNRYDAATATLYQPTIITRESTRTPGVYEVTGRISADFAQYDGNTGRWNLTNGILYSADANKPGPQPVASYQAPDLTARDIPINQRAGINSLLSYRQLSALAEHKTSIKDTVELLSQKYFRITDALINLTMLMVSLPVLICRDPRTMKSAVLISFILTAACFVTTFVCRMFSTEVVFADRVMPELWAWLPVFIFLPIAFIELDAMKT